MTIQDKTKLKARLVKLQLIKNENSTHYIFSSETTSRQRCRFHACVVNNKNSSMSVYDRAIV